LRKRSAVAAKLSCYRIADDRRPESSSRKSGRRCRIGVVVFVAGVRPPTRVAPGRGIAIMKLTTMTKVTIDGVMQGDGHASDEDRRNGFERGGWARGKGDNETRAFISQTYQRADAFLFGRRAYELFAGSWGSWTEQDVPGWEPVMRALNTQPRYVASTTLTDPEWSGTTVLSGDVAAAVRELKAAPGG
jgi:dihydrofolate reductase